MKPLFLNEGNPISGSKNPMCGSQEYHGQITRQRLIGGWASFHLIHYTQPPWETFTPSFVPGVFVRGLPMHRRD